MKAKDSSNILPVIEISKERGEELYKLSIDIMVEYTDKEGISMGDIMKYIMNISPSLTEGELVFISYTIGRMVSPVVEYCKAMKGFQQLGEYLHGR